MLKIAKGEIENYIDVSNKGTKDEGYGEKFRAYSKTKTATFKSLIKHLCIDLIVKEVLKLKLTFDEVEAFELIFIRHVQSVMHHISQIMMLFNVVVGMNFQSIKVLVTIELTKTDCCQTVDKVNSFPI